MYPIVNWGGGLEINPLYIFYIQGVFKFLVVAMLSLFSLSILFLNRIVIGAILTSQYANSLVHFVKFFKVNRVVV